MSTRHWLVGALVAVYPPSWRGEYAAELEDVLLKGSLGPQVVLNVLWNGLRQRGREFQVVRLWRRALLAFLTMELIAALSAAITHVYRLGSGAANREFEIHHYLVFMSIVVAPHCLGALLGMILPACLALRSYGCFFKVPVAIALGIVLSVPALAVVVLGGWLIDGWGSLPDFVANVLRHPRTNLLLLVMFSAGAAIVLSGRRVDRAPLSETVAAN